MSRFFQMQASEMVDKYSCFAELAKRERKDVDYGIAIERRDSGVAIIAPHGGKIEPMTTELARVIAGNNYDFYSFIGMKESRNRDLHITSHRFDEPECLELISRCDVVVAIHGRADKSDSAAICLGGRDAALRQQIETNLKEAGFSAQLDDGSYPGTERKNVCNRGRREMGAQLELPRSLRDSFSTATARRDAFANAVRVAILSHTF